MSSTKQQDGRKVALILMKSTEAEATLDVVRADSPELTISDHATYYSIEGLDEISIDLDHVAEELGEPITMSQWLVTMSSYIGRVNSDERHFKVTSAMLQMGVNGGVITPS
jgi:hypothetical protein